MFEERPRVAWRAVSPPRPVLVRLQRAFPPTSHAWARGLPLWVRAAGFQIAGEVPGELHGWVLSSVGRWWANVRFQMRSQNGDLRFEVHQLVPSDAVRPYEDPPR